MKRLTRIHTKDGFIIHSYNVTQRDGYVECDNCHIYELNNPQSHSEGDVEIFNRGIEEINSIIINIETYVNIDVAFPFIEECQRVDLN